MPCDSPITIKPKFNDNPKSMRAIDKHRTYAVPCGRCAPCKKRRVAEWTFRLLHEERVSLSAYFVTLTYDNSTIPISYNGMMTLNPRHFTLFIKQLRNLQNRDKDTPSDTPPIKYYAAGEYGETRYRPHLHVILFNLYKLEHLGMAWRYGKIDIQKEPKAGAFAYTAKYIDKDKRIPIHKNDDRVKEFSRQSKGIGLSYLTPQAIRWHRSNYQENTYVSQKSGIKQPMPRYFKNIIFTAEQRLIQGDIAIAHEEIRQRELQNSKTVPILQHINLEKQSREAKFNQKPKKRDTWQNQ